MPQNISLYETRTMAKLVERMPKKRTFLLDTFFKRIETFDTEKIDVDFVKGNRVMAPFVHPKRGGKILKDSGYQTKTYTPPLLGPQKLTTADKLANRMAGEPLYNGKTPEERAVDKLEAELKELDSTITIREEWMAAQALFTGLIPIKGEGIDEVIDFGFENKETLAAKAQWNKETSNPLADLKRWKKEVQKKGFVNPNVVIMADDAADAFIAHPLVKDLLDVKAYDLAVIKPKDLGNGATYIGTLKGENLDIYTYNAWYQDEDSDEPMPYVPDSTVLLASTEAEYSRNYGAVTLLDEATGEWHTFESTRVADKFIKKNPDRKFVTLYSRPLPIPHEVDSWFVAVVM